MPVGKLHFEYPLHDLKPDPENPRFIDEESRAMLAASIETLGVVKPLIVQGDMLVAGHQRSVGLRSLGIDRAPVFVLHGKTTHYDRLAFNQQDNGVDQMSGKEDAVFEGGVPPGFQEIPPARLSANMRAPGAMVRATVAELILRFGAYSGCVAICETGEVIHGAQYACAAKSTHHPILTYGIPAEFEKEARFFLSKEYGVFNYDKIERNTFLQTLAQLPRLRKNGDGNRSSLYDLRVIPYLERHEGIWSLDFGSGQGDYYRMLSGRGFNMREIELFRRKGFTKTLDPAATRRMIEGAARHLRKKGRFDVVVCDSVLNSVDSEVAERSVMVTLNAMVKLGGRAFVSGRQAARQEQILTFTKSFDKDHFRRHLFFADKNGMTAHVREGKWFFQWAHSRDRIQEIFGKAGFRIDAYHDVHNTAFHVEATKIKEMPVADVEAAFRFEFDQPVGGGATIGKSEVMMNAWRNS